MLEWRTIWLERTKDWNVRYIARARGTVRGYLEVTDTILQLRHEPTDRTRWYILQNGNEVWRGAERVAESRLDEIVDDILYDGDWQIAGESRQEV